jgi:hypothetical protein
MPGRIFFKKKQNLDHSCLSIVAGQILSYVWPNSKALETWRAL